MSTVIDQNDACLKSLRCIWDAHDKSLCFLSLVCCCIMTITQSTKSCVFKEFSFWFLLGAEVLNQLIKISNVTLRLRDDSLKKIKAQKLQINKAFSVMNTIIC